MINMEENILDLIEKNKKLFFGPAMNDISIYYHCMEYDIEKKMLIFNTDVDYNFNNKIEEVMKTISQNFCIEKYLIKVVQIGGNCLDLDITLDLYELENEQIVEIINYIKENLYESKSWIIEKINK